MRTELIATWLLTLALHAGVLLSIAWVVDRSVLRAQLAWRELLWRGALFGAVLTASVQSMLDIPVPTRMALPAAVVVTTEAGAPVALSPAQPPVARVQESAQAAQTIPAEAEAGAPPPAAATSAHAIGADASAAWRPSWQATLMAAWLAGALLMFMRLGIAWLRLESRLARAQPMAPSPFTTDVAALAIAAGTARPRVMVMDDLGSPIAALGQRIVLPRWALELLDREQIGAMLAHEVAHLARRDPLWKLLAAICRALLWFLPLTTVARRRLDEIAELSCDRWAANHLGDGRVLAACLAECAGHHLGGLDAGLVPAMAHRDSPLLQRIDHLIEGTPVNTNYSRMRAGIVALLALALAAVALPGFDTAVHAQPALAPSPPVAPAPPTPPAAADGTHARISSHSGMTGSEQTITRIEISDDGVNYSAKVSGNVVLNERDDDIVSLDRGASASFAQTQAGISRRIEYASRDGVIERRYFVDEREQPLDAQARTWMANFIPVVVRETAINAEARVRRIHAGGGSGAVLDEVGRIRSDYARGAYLRQLFAITKLSPAETTRAVGLIDGFDSDYELRNTLAALAAANPLDAGQQQLVLAQAAKIGSDYERAELLIGMLPTLERDAGLRAAWLRAAAGIGSDYEHRRVLSALLEGGNVDDATLADVVEAAKTIGSDYERRELLVSLIGRVGDAERIAPAYVAAVSDIGSDFERREALLALIGGPKFGATAARAVLDAADGIGSDFECREVLVGLARVMPADATLIARYREVTRRLSDYERGTAERALDRFAG